jgi:hypothetical protein
VKGGGKKWVEQPKQWEALIAGKLSQNNNKKKTLQT